MIFLISRPVDQITLDKIWAIPISTKSQAAASAEFEQFNYGAIIGYMLLVDDCMHALNCIWNHWPWSGIQCNAINQNESELEKNKISFLFIVYFSISELYYAENPIKIEQKNPEM